MNSRQNITALIELLSIDQKLGQEIRVEKISTCGAYAKRIRDSLANTSEDYDDQ